MVTATRRCGDVLPRNRERRPRRHLSPHQPYPDVLDVDYAAKEEPESSLEGARPDPTQCKTPSQTTTPGPALLPLHQDGNTLLDRSPI